MLYLSQTFVEDFLFMDEIFQLIIKNRESMSKTQRKLADYIVENRSQVPFLNITSLATLSNTSEASIVRFCTFLGFKGYPEFKNALQASLQEKLSIRERLKMSDVAYANDDHAFIADIFHDDINSISTTLENLDMNVFFQIIQELQDARQIVIISYRSALSLGVFLEYYLHLIFDHVTLLPTASLIEQDEVISGFDSETVVFGITFYRYTKETIHLMEYASRRGCSTIALTDTLQSPVIPFSKHALFAETRLPGMSETYTGPLSIINAIIIYLSKLRKDKLDRKLQSMEQRWVDFDIFDE